MTKFSYSAVLAMAVVAVAAAMLLSGSPAAAADCKPAELMPCLPAISQGTPPTSECCAKLKEQEPCFCDYIKDPNLGQYVSSPNAQKVLAACSITPPKC